MTTACLTRTSSPLKKTVSAAGARAASRTCPTESVLDSSRPCVRSRPGARAEVLARCCGVLAFALPKTRVLEVGCGTGAWLRRIRQMGSATRSEVWAVEPPARLLDGGARRSLRGRRQSAVLQRGESSRSTTPASISCSGHDVQLHPGPDCPTPRGGGGCPRGRSERCDSVVRLSREQSVERKRAGIGRRPSSRELFPGCEIDLHPITLPPCRWLCRIAPWSHALWLFLTSVPWLCTRTTWVSSAGGDRTSMCGITGLVTLQQSAPRSTLRFCGA